MFKRTYGDAPTSYKRRMLGGGAYQVHSESRAYGGSYAGRRRGSRSGRYRKSGYYGRYGRNDQMARIRRGLHIEKKFFDTPISFMIDATGEVPATGQLNLIGQGVTESTRVGRQCQVRSIQIRGQAVWVPGASTTGRTTAFIMLVQDKQCNGAAIVSATDVLTGTNFTSAMINMANSERFRILKRWELKFLSGAGVSAGFGEDSNLFDFYKKCNIPLEFSSTTGAITEIKSNNLFLLAGTDGGTDDTITVTGTCRLRFTDL